MKGKQSAVYIIIVQSKKKQVHGVLQRGKYVRSGEQIAATISSLHDRRQQFYLAVDASMFALFSLILSKWPSDLKVESIFCLISAWAVTVSTGAFIYWECASGSISPAKLFVWSRPSNSWIPGSFFKSMLRACRRAASLVLVGDTSHEAFACDDLRSSSLAFMDNELKETFNCRGSAMWWRLWVAYVVFDLLILLVA